MTDKRIRTIEAVMKDITEYFVENEEIYNTAIEELDAYDGYLGDNRYYYMDDLSEFYVGTDPIELLQRAFFGWDEDSWSINERGEKEHRVSFNPNREYFRYNGYGNLVSTDYRDYSDQLDEYLIFDMLENVEEIDAIKEDAELQALFAELQAAYDEQEA